MVLASCNPFGAQNSEVASRFSEKLCTSNHSKVKPVPTQTLDFFNIRYPVTRKGTLRPRSKNFPIGLYQTSMCILCLSISLYTPLSLFLGAALITHHHLAHSLKELYIYNTPTPHPACHHGNLQGET